VLVKDYTNSHISAAPCFGPAGDGTQYPSVFQQLPLLELLFALTPTNLQHAVTADG
jgi:hypothetical protein